MTFVVSCKTPKPFSRFTKTWHQWSRRRPDTTCKIWLQLTTTELIWSLVNG